VRKNLVIILFLFLAVISQAQPAVNNDAPIPKEAALHPVYNIELRTIEGNVLKGLLLQVNDSSLIVYPGNGKEWNKNKGYKPVLFRYGQITYIMLKKTEITGWRTILSVAVAAEQKGKTPLPEPVDYHQATVTISGDPKEITYYVNGEKDLFTAFKNQTL